MGNLSEVLIGYSARKDEEVNMMPMRDEVVDSKEIAKEVIEQPRFLLVDTIPDKDTEWKESYICDSWREAYEKMVCLLFDESSEELENNLLTGRSFIKIYSAQTYDGAGVKHVYHIVGM